MSSQFHRDLTEILARVHTPEDAARAKGELEQLVRESQGYCPWCGEGPPLRCDMADGLVEPRKEAGQ